MKMKLISSLRIAIALVSAATPLFPDPAMADIVLAAIRIVIAINSLMNAYRGQKAQSRTV